MDDVTVTPAAVTVKKPNEQEWIPAAFAVLAVAVIYALIFGPHSNGEAVTQGAISVANTLAGIAGGTYVAGRGKTSTP